MAYTPPAGNAADFQLETYTPPSGDQVNFELNPQPDRRRAGFNVA